MAAPTNIGPVSIPAHVPPELVLPFNPWANMGDRLHEALERVRPYGAVVFSPAHHILGVAPNGSWMVTGAKEARELLLDTVNFSSRNTTGIAQAIGETFALAPIEVDPPEHFKTRSLLNPFFSPSAMRALDGKIRQRAGDLVDGVLDRGRCDFIADFAKILPSEIFLDMFGLPHENLKEFMEWEEQIMGATEFAVRINGLKSVANYLRDAIRVRQASARDDVLSAVVHSKIDGRQITESEALGMSMLLYIAGLDTVVNSLGWQFRHLAEHPADQDRLRQDPKLTPAAVEEYFRGYSTVSVTRIVTGDVEFAGVKMKRGDVVAVPTALASRDPEDVQDADKVDINRNTKRHFAFGFGPHMCLGLHLARIEVVASIDLWLAKTKGFRIPAGEEIPCHGGAVLTVQRLPLMWN